MQSDTQHDDSTSKKWRLSSAEQLQLHQLQAKAYWSNKQEKVSETESEGISVATVAEVSLPEQWRLLQGVTLYDWQEECVHRWLEQGGQGTVKVVTGAGKTMLALGIMQQLQNEREPELRVAIVVPTIVLMNQWYDELWERSNLPLAMIGRLGGGYHDSFSTHCRILVSVLNSAYDKLPHMAQTMGLSDNLLLVMDECHRAGSTVMKQVFDTPRRYNLGLSATPERAESPAEEYDEDMAQDDQDGHETKGTVGEETGDTVDEEVLAYNNSLLGEQLGPIVYNMTVREAFQRGILPPYELRHYGLPLAPDEAQAYHRITQTIQDARRELQAIARADGVAAGAAFHSWCRRQGQQGGELGSLASRYVENLRRRKALLYRAEARQQAVLKLLKQELDENEDAKALLFHESISEAMDLWYGLMAAEMPAVPEQSDLANSIRQESLDLFRKGIAQILVSVRSLIEGFNVPATDIGIIVASSTSVRQRIQTIGRLLRKHRTRHGEEKHAVIHILYIAKTVDERIYEKVDWETLTGAERNTYYLWDVLQGEAPQEQEGPPRKTLPRDWQVERAQLACGLEYPGRYEGTEYTVDMSGTIFIGDKTQRVVNPQGLLEHMRAVRPELGRFRVTPNKQYVLVRMPKGAEWVTRFVMHLSEPFVLQPLTDGGATVNLQHFDALEPGDLYEGAVSDNLATYYYQSFRGQSVIAKKVNRGKVYALLPEHAMEKERGVAAEQLLADLKEAEQKTGHSLSEFSIMNERVALYLSNGQWWYIGTLAQPLEFRE